MSKPAIVPKKVVFVEQSARIERFELPELKNDEILVKTHCSLVSIGTESTALTKRWNDDSFRANPGYALAGEVMEVGSDVRDYRTGDRIFSLKNHSSYAVCSTKPWDTMKIPDDVSYEEASFTALASVSLHGVRRANIKLGESTVIIGMGLVELMALQLAGMNGAYPLIAVDLCKERLELAKKLGADKVINPGEECLNAKIREYAGSDGADCIIEAVGSPHTLQNALKIAAPGARIIVLGVITGDIGINLFDEFILKELNLISAQQPVNPIQDTVYYHFTQQSNRRLVMEYIRKKKLRVDELITHRFRYDRVPELYSLLGEAKDADYNRKTIKSRDMIGVIIDWSK